MPILRDPSSGVPLFDEAGLLNIRTISKQLVVEVRRFAVPLLTAASARGSVSTWDAGGPWL